MLPRTSSPSARRASQVCDYETAIAAVDYELERVYRLPVRKGLNPLVLRDFLVIERRLKNALLGVARAAEAQVLRRALVALDVDWKRTTLAQRRKVVEAARAALSDPPRGLGAGLAKVLQVRGESLVGQTVIQAARRFGFNIAPSLSQVDKRIVKHVASSHANFVRDEFGRRAEALSAQARAIVADGVEQGLSREAVKRNLAAELGAAYQARSDNYWSVVANSFANRARSYGHLSSMKRGGIARYRVLAVLDTVTSKQCRLMHDRTFEVSAGLANFEAVAALQDPEEVKFVQPWLQVGKNDDGDEFVYYKDRQGQRHSVGTFAGGGTGVDETGDWRNVSPEAALQRVGILTPPFHGNCRTTIVADE